MASPSSDEGRHGIGHFFITFTITITIIIITIIINIITIVIILAIIIIVNISERTYTIISNGPCITGTPEFPDRGFVP